MPIRVRWLLTLTQLLKRQYPQVAVKTTTMREDVGESERAQHFRTLLFGGFAGVSILLAVIGMFGVTAYTVAQKRFEFALRFALGAQRGQVLGSVVGSALVVSAMGVVLAGCAEPGADARDGNSARQGGGVRSGSVWSCRWRACCWLRCCDAAAGVAGGYGGSDAGVAG